jgi:two-component system NtrC family response regulator
VTARVLFVDDDDAVREVVAFQLRAAGYEVAAFGAGRAAIDGFEERGADVVITDLRMDGLDGMAVLRAISERDAAVPVLVLTAYGSVETAVAAMQAGAFDYVTKPVARDALLLRVRRALEHAALLTENRALRAQVGGERTLLVASGAMERLLAQVGRVATADVTVLLTGETGTGKELVARELHRLSGRKGPFVAVNCAAIPSELLEAELFGHTKGAFTGAVRGREGRFRAAQGGTLLLDEIGDLPLRLQPKLLRVLQEREVEPVGAERPVPIDVRIVAATHRDLAERVAAGTFREDLYHRLAALPLEVPALRDQPDAVGPLFELFVAAEARRAGRALRVDDGVADALRGRSFPGNVRELENLARRVVLLADGPTIRVSDLPRAAATHIPAGQALRVALDREPWAVELPAGSLPLRVLERSVIDAAIALHRGNKSAAARYLGVPRHVLLYRLR